MKSMKNRFVCLTLVLIMSLALFVIPAYAQSESEPNDDAGTATAILVNTQIDASFANVGGATDNDWYKLTIAQPGELRLAFTKPTGSTLYAYFYSVNSIGDLTELYRKTFLASSSSAADYVEVSSDKLYLPPGDYFILLHASLRSDSKTDYGMTAAFTPMLNGTLEFEPNNEDRTATSIELNTQISGSFTNSNDTDNDWYSVVLDQQREVRFQIRKPARANVTVVVYARDAAWVKTEVYRKVFHAATNPTTDYEDVESDNVYISTGFYYIWVYASFREESVTDYTMMAIETRLLASSQSAPTLSSWAQADVNAAIAAGLVPQSLQSQYTQAITRAEFCALAVAVYEKVAQIEISGRTTFSDTSDVNVEKMAYLGVVNGLSEGRFGPNESLTREQAATILARLAKAVGKPLYEQEASFNDNANISAWALESVGQVQASGIMRGDENNRFSPQGVYTREQSIITILRLNTYVR